MPEQEPENHHFGGRRGWGEEEVGGGEEEKEEEAQLQLHMGSVTGMTSKKSLKLWGRIRHKGVTVLIDSGATHNFVSKQIVEELGLQPDASQEFTVKVGDGHIVKKKGVCRNVELELPNLKVI